MSKLETQCVCLLVEREKEMERVCCECQWLELTSERCAVVDVSEQIAAKFSDGNGWALAWTWSSILEAI